MDRRSTLAAFAGKLRSATTTIDPVISAGAGLEPYNGPWTIREAAHLMRRTTFGPSQRLINEAVSKGVDASVDTLIGTVEIPEPPLKQVLDAPDPNNPRLLFVNDPEVKYGETWVNARLFPDSGDPQNNQQIINYRNRSIFSWIPLMAHEDKMSIREKMFIFWHNHFVVSEFRLPQMVYQYASTLFEFVLGDFKELTKRITVDPSMLLYLNGAENINTAPNENYARELLELFTIGKGNLAGPGDYTNYTEDDIREISKTLTGWTINFRRLNGSRVLPSFEVLLHDNSTKNLSHRFNNAVIQENGEEEYKDVIDIIFQQDECSRFICRKLYRYFVHYNITPEIEQEVIEPMAQIVRDNNYVVGPAIAALLKSAHFYSEDAIGCMIKNPGDFIVSITQGLNVPRDVANVYTDYNYGATLYGLMSEAGMTLFQHPDVAGWKAYYQVPQYYRVWLNTSTLPKRTLYSTILTRGGTIPGQRNPIPPIIPVLEIADAIPNAENPDILIEKLSELLNPYGLLPEQREFLKGILLPNEPDSTWTFLYNLYKADPGNALKRLAVENKLRDLFARLMDQPEAQLM